MFPRKKRNKCTSLLIYIKNHMKTGKVCSKFAQNFARFKKEIKSITGAKNLLNFYGLIGIAT